MRSSSFGLALAVVICLLALPLRAAEPKPLLDFAAPGVEKRFTPSWGSAEQVSVTRSDNPAGVILTVKPGPAGYPGIDLAPDNGKAWDLSSYGRVELRVVNTGSKGSSFALRVDNAPVDGVGEPWNAEQTYLAPGQSGTISVIFGHSFGHKPAFALNPSAVVRVLMFTSKADDPQSFRIESLSADGPAGEKPPVDPNSVRIKPRGGVLLGTGASLEAKQIEPFGGAQASVNGGIRITVAAGKADQGALLKPEIGRWDLRDYSQIRLKIRNEGTSPITPRAKALSDGNGITDVAAASAPLQPGTEQEIVVPFAPRETWKGIPNSGDKTSWDGVAGTGTKFLSDAVSAIRITAEHTIDSTLLVTSIVAEAPVATLPDWLGKRPPVDGQWVQTFDENFDSPVLDLARWNNTGPNFWDQSSHWSKANVILGDGVAKLRYEKKAGTHNDEPNGKQTSYTSGFLDTYGKWVQRYGYFEARMKLPAAPGLWPAFWMMPDRGPSAGEQWQRQDTAKGGMEFDIMEHLTRWGPRRYNIAQHWDGYTESHKQTGTGCLYMEADKDGFITCGMLWLPGQVIYYCNGKETARWEDPRISDVASDLMFTLPTGGWDNNSLDDKQLPADFVIDYVRAWQRNDLASPADTASSRK